MEILIQISIYPWYDKVCNNELFVLNCEVGVVIM